MHAVLAFVSPPHLFALRCGSPVFGVSTANSRQSTYAGPVPRHSREGAKRTLKTNVGVFCEAVHCYGEHYASGRFYVLLRVFDPLARVVSSLNERYAPCVSGALDLLLRCLDHRQRCTMHAPGCAPRMLSTVLSVDCSGSRCGACVCAPFPSCISSRQWVAQVLRSPAAARQSTFINGGSCFGAVRPGWICLALELASGRISAVA